MNLDILIFLKTYVYKHESKHKRYTLLLFIGKLKPTIGMITYRNTCALDSKVKVAYKLILKLLPVIFFGKCSSNSNYFGL